MKPYYDRHRRIKKRYKIGGGLLCGKHLLAIYVTWGQLNAAQREAKAWSELFSNGAE